jgi:hypothetical protein
MPIDQLLISEITTNLGQALAGRYLTSAAVNDLFEAYVLSLILSAAQNQEANVSYEFLDRTGIRSAVRLRTSPGSIYISPRYSHAVIAFPNCPELEAHVGIYVEGRSGVLHECDVAVLDRDEAQLCRREPVHPRNTKLLISVECKFHSSTIGLGYGRGFLGLSG